LIAYGIRVEADALVLAAAPEMIAVLEELERWSDPEGAFDADGMRRAVRAALAKVRGGGQQVVDWPPPKKPRPRSIRSWATALPEWSV
jgi:hypothetical protein